MADNAQQVLELVVQLVGRENVDKFADGLKQSSAAAQQAAAEVYEFADAYDVIEQEAPKAARALGAVDLALEEIARDAEKAAAATAKVTGSHDKLSKGLKDSKSGMAGFGQSALQASRFIQDFQAAGLNGVLNNVEGLAMALGGGAGLAGTLTILGTAVYAFQEPIARFLKTFMEGIDPDRLRGYTDQLATLKERLEALESKPHKIGIDLQELQAAREQVDAIKEGLDAFEKVGKQRTEAEKKSGEEVGKAFEQAPGGAEAARDRLRAAVVRQALADSVTVRAARQRQAEIDRDLASGQATGEQDVMLRGERGRLDSEITRAQTEIAKKGGLAEQTLGKILAQAQGGAGPGQEQAQRQLQFLANQSGQADLAGRIRGASPENTRAKLLEEQGRDLEEKAREELKRAEEEQDREARDRLEEQLKNQAVTEKQLSGGVEKGRKAEVKKIRDTLGDQLQGAYEVAIARNRAAQASGAPVARSAGQAREFEGLGIPYAVPEAMLARRLQAQMQATFERRGAAEGSAREAAQGIVGAAQTDLAKKSAQLGETGLSVQQQTLMLTGELEAALGRQSEAYKQLQSEVQRQRGRLGRTARQMDQPSPTNLPFGAQ